jgi:glycosyltransferase involved in cell wall biosynthesis
MFDKDDNTLTSLADKRILALTKYSSNGASSRLRTIQYLPFLDSVGAQVDVSPFFKSDYLTRLYSGERGRMGTALHAYLRRLFALLTSRKYHLLWIEKELFPYLPGIFECIPRLLGIPYIIDYDDAIFHNYDLHRSRFVRKLLACKLDSILAGSHTVTAGNGYLADYARQHGAKNVIQIPTVVNTNVYQPVSNHIPSPIRIGWIGSPSTEKYLNAILPALEKVSNTTPITLVTIGANATSDFMNIHVEQHEWSEDTEAHLLASIDIGLMPIPDLPFERGKCGYKLIQYMACAKPVVASDVGVNSEIVTNEVGILVREMGEWIEAIERLCRDVGLRKQMGQAGRSLVEAKYSLQSTAPKLINVLESAMQK